MSRWSNNLAARWPHLLGVLLCCAELGLTQERPKEPIKFDKNRAFLTVTDFTLPSLGTPGKGEHDTYCALALHTSMFTNEELLAAARKDVSYSDLMVKNDVLREDIRFELVRFDGRLKRLKQIGTFPELREAGLTNLCEAWVFPDGESNPICVLLNECPAGVEPNLEYEKSLPVTVAGYFFKITQYESNRPNSKNPGKPVYQNAPLLVGQTLQMNEPKPSPSAGLPALLPVVIVSAALLLFIILGLTFLLTRSDKGYRRYAEIQQTNPFVDPPSPPQGSSS
jgi:hypothetical protein